MLVIILAMCALLFVLNENIVAFVDNPFSLLNQHKAIQNSHEQFKAVNKRNIDKQLEIYQRDFDVFGYTWNNSAGA